VEVVEVLDLPPTQEHVQVMEEVREEVLVFLEARELEISLEEQEVQIMQVEVEVWVGLEEMLQPMVVVMEVWV
jgi:hypothetical protein